MIKVIAFDYADVITPSPVAKWFNENLKPTDKKYIYFKNHAKGWNIGEANAQMVYELMYKVTGIPAHKIWERFYKNYIADKEIIKLIKQLKKDYKIFLFSNFVGEILRKLLKKDNITELFDEIIISSEHKMQKPSFDFFEILFKTSGVKKEEILFIDDREENVDAGNKFGIKSIQFINPKQLKIDLKRVLTK